MNKALFLARSFGAAFALVLLGFFAHAVVGTPPEPGPRLVDGTWLNALASGQNWDFQSGLTAVGNSQATALQLVAGNYQYEVDTAAASTGVALPACSAGTSLIIYNNGANTITVYPSITNNPATGAQDTILNTTSTTQATHTQKMYSCAKTGVWGAQ